MKSLNFSWKFRNFCEIQKFFVYLRSRIYKNIMAGKPIEIPKGVINVGKYYQYLDKQKEIQEHPGRYYQTSNERLRIDLASTLAVIKKQIKDLTSEEQEKIIGKTPIFRSLLGQAGMLKRDAYSQNEETGKRDKDGLEKVADRKTEILELFGRFFSAGEIHKMIVVEWEIDLPFDAIRKFQRDNITKIQELQKDYELSFSDVRLGKRRARLDEYNWIYNKFKEKFKVYESRDDGKMLQSLLESIKKEVDGDLVINGKLQVDIEHTINLQIQQDLLKEFNITALVIGKLAGRLNIHPMFLVSRLARSHYAKFTGFAPASKGERDNDEIYAPTGITYDWDNIIQDNAVQVLEEAKQKALPAIEDAIVISESGHETKTLMPTIKEMMLMKIQSERKKFQQTAKNLEERGTGSNKPEGIQ